MTNPKILIIGAGAVGGITAAILKNAGYDIHLVCKYPELAEKISNEGIFAFGVCGEIKITIPSVDELRELEGKYDLVMMATKAYVLEEIARQLDPYLHEGSRVVSMQNGICEDKLAAIVGEDRTVGCVVGWGATMHEPGRLEMTSEGEFIIGNWNNQKDDVIIEIKSILEHILPTKISDNILSDLYSKLIINSCITTLGAISGLYVGEMLARKKVRNLFIKVIREAIHVAEGMELQVKPYAGKLDYYSFLKQNFISEIKQHLTIRVIGFKYRKLKSSSLQSLERGGITEVDYFNGYIAKQGQLTGVSTPVNEQLTQMIKEIEEGKRKISPENFHEF